MREKQLPHEILEFFRRQGSKGGKLGGSAGGKKAAEGMTPEQRSARAKKASAAAVAARKARGKAKR
jgi:hypothetical protein